MFTARQALWPRFGLRLTLLLVSCFCVIAAWKSACWRLARLEAERSQSILQQVKLNDGRATFDPATNTVYSGFAYSSKTLDFCDRFRNSRIVNLRVWLPDSDDLAVLSRFNNIERLQLEGLARSSPLTAADLEQLANCGQLQSLSISTPVTHEALSGLEGCPSLRSLHLSRIEIGDEMLASLEQLQGLQSLTLKSEELPDGAAERLAKALPDCQVTVECPASEFVIGESADPGGF